MKREIGIIGFGNMGSAIARGIKKRYKVYIFDTDKAKLENLEGVEVLSSIKELAGRVDVIILAVKPQDFDSLLVQLKDITAGKLVISIAAGITSGYIENFLNSARVVRVMPNMPAKIGQGMICVSIGKSADKKDVIFARKLFANLGKVLEIKEKMMDAATAVSGSGPGYFYEAIEGKAAKQIKNIASCFSAELASSAVNLGFTPIQARLLARTTIRGSILYIKQAKLSALEAKKQVVSKGGTTEAALEVLHKGGSLEEAVKAALKRAEDLSN